MKPRDELDNISTRSNSDWSDSADNGRKSHEQKVSTASFHCS